MTDAAAETLLDDAAEALPPPSDPAALARELEHKNLVWGWSLFGLFVVLFGGTVLVALAWIWLS